MTLHLTAIALLIVAFIIATVTPLNLGALALVATFFVGAVWMGMSTDDLYAGFPGNLLVVLVGVTYLFNVAKANGTIDWLLGGAVKLTGGRDWIVPWIMFAAAGLFSGIGALFSVPIVAPIALAFAARHRISQFYMGLMVIHGTCAGCLAPISVYGVIVSGILQTNGFTPDPMKIFLISLVTNVIIGVIITVLFGRKKVAGGQSVATEMAVVGAGPTGTAPTGGSAGAATGSTGGTDSAGQDGRPDVRLGVEGWLTLAAIVLLIVLGVALRLDIGLLAITLCIAIGLYNPKRHKEALSAVPWSVVLLVCGVLTYVGVLEHIGTVGFLGDSVAAIGIPLLAAAALAYIGGIVSAFATSSGVIAALVPLAVPLLQAGDLNPISLVAVIAVASTVVDVSPFSTHGAVVVANTTPDQRDAVLRNLLRWGIAIVTLVPALLWALVIVPGF
ncbi:transporter, UIT1 family [Pseudonocardia ammonioxydans]|uniref:Transporter, UIT1 family n=1 Tax=Pseudonocardia ammonioxydans TaxID=260086 RepID=A0A1I5HM41_PSUAM|nr:SLC13 family permease [Pseudonocardia ammonioxydans]SFO49365.1 transporter, UIT1 family [Pseudonocardia ammonioxydans]